MLCNGRKKMMNNNNDGMECSSGIEGNPTVFYRLMPGSTAQTNKYHTFYLQQRPDNGDTWADIKVNHPLDYESIKEYNLTIRVEVSTHFFFLPRIQAILDFDIESFQGHLSSIQFSNNKFACKHRKTTPTFQISLIFRRIIKIRNSKIGKSLQIYRFRVAKIEFMSRFHANLLLCNDFAAFISSGNLLNLSRGKMIRCSKTSLIIVDLGRLCVI